MKQRLPPLLITWREDLIENLSFPSGFQICQSAPSISSEETFWRWCILKVVATDWRREIVHSLCSITSLIWRFWLDEVKLLIEYENRQPFRVQFSHHKEELPSRIRSPMRFSASSQMFIIQSKCVREKSEEHHKSWSNCNHHMSTAWTWPRWSHLNNIATITCRKMHLWGLVKKWYQAHSLQEAYKDKAKPSNVAYRPVHVAPKEI